MLKRSTIRLVYKMRKSLNLFLIAATIGLFLFLYSGESGSSRENTLFDGLSPVQDIFNIADKANSCDFRLAKSIFQLNSCQQQAFIKYKEDQYGERRNRIQAFCQSLEEEKKKEFSVFRTDYNFYIETLKLGYCGIAKIASTTWRKNFYEVQSLYPDPTPAPLRQWTWRNRPVGGYPLELPEDEFREKMNGFSSVVIVRHPLDRLASLYYNKVVDQKNNTGSYQKISSLGNNGTIENMQHDICEYIVDNGITAGEKPYRSPELYCAECVLKWNTANRFEMHSHPQIRQCPFCKVNFTVIIKLEELKKEDTAYLIEKFKPHFDFVKPSQILNESGLSIKNSESKEKLFWKCVKPSTIKNLLKLYKTDFTVFDYDYVDYFKKLGLEYKIV